MFHKRLVDFSIHTVSKSSLNCCSLGRLKPSPHFRLLCLETRLNTTIRQNPWSRPWLDYKYAPVQDGDLTVPLTRDVVTKLGVSGSFKR